VSDLSCLIGKNDVDPNEWGFAIAAGGVAAASRYV